MPLDSAGFFSMVTYSWLTRYMKLAYQRELKREDIPLCCNKDHCDDAVQRLVAKFDLLFYFQTKMKNTI